MGSNDGALRTLSVIVWLTGFGVGALDRNSLERLLETTPIGSLTWAFIGGNVGAEAIAIDSKVGLWLSTAPASFLAPPRSVYAIIPFQILGSCGQLNSLSHPLPS
jgi:hypothetical protein